MKNKKTFGCGVFVVIFITFPLFLIAFGIIEIYIKEQFIYGEIVEGVVLNIEEHRSSSKGGNQDYNDFLIKPLYVHKKFVLKSSYPLQMTALEGTPYPYLFTETKIGDTLTLKIQTEKQAKIVSIKGNTIKNINPNLSLFLAFIILSICSIPCYAFYNQVTKEYKSKIIRFFIVYFFINIIIYIFLIS